jgi:hypothetical protein
MSWCRDCGHSILLCCCISTCQLQHARVTAASASSCWLPLLLHQQMSSSSDATNTAQASRQCSCLQNNCDIKSLASRSFLFLVLFAACCSISSAQSTMPSGGQLLLGQCVNHCTTRWGSLPCRSVLSRCRYCKQCMWPHDLQDSWMDGSLCQYAQILGPSHQF